MKRSVLNLLLVSAVLSSAANCPDKPETLQELGEVEPQMLAFDYLRMFRADLEVPGVLAGDHAVFTSGCTKRMAPGETDAAEAVEARYRDEKQIALQMKAALEATLKGAEARGNIDLSVLREAKEAWSVQIEGLRYRHVDPMQVEPDFEREVCRLEELGWLRNDSEVVVGLLKAEKITLQSQAEVSRALRLALENAFSEETGTLEGEFGLKFTRSLEEDGSYKIRAENVFFGYRAANMFVEWCEEPAWQVEPDRRHKACGYTFSFSKLEATDKQYILRIKAKGMGETKEFVARFKNATLYAQDPIRIFEIEIWPEGNGYKAEFESLVAAPKR